MTFRAAQDRRADHRDLPGPADLLPDRAPDTPGHRTTDHTRRALRRATGQTRRPADLRSLARLRLIPATANEPPGIPQPSPLQARLLALLEIDPTRPR